MNHNRHCDISVQKNHWAIGFSLYRICYQLSKDIPEKGSPPGPWVCFFFSLICKMQVLASCSGLCGVTSRIGFRSRTRRAWESPSHATCSTSLSTTAHTAVEPHDRRWQNTNFCQRYYRSRVMASDSRQKMQRRPFLICSHGTWRIRPIKPKLLLARGSERFFQELRTYGAISVPEIYK